MLKSINVYWLQKYLCKSLYLVVGITIYSFEKHLAVIIDKCLTYGRQCVKAILSANNVIVILDKIYNSVLLPKMEYTQFEC